MCYPSNMQISEHRCEIPLQNLLDHTVLRILQINKIKKLEKNVDNFKIFYK